MKINAPVLKLKNPATYNAKNLNTITQRTVRVSTTTSVTLIVKRISVLMRIFANALIVSVTEGAGETSF